MKKPKFNAIDFLIIIVVIVVIAAGAYILGSKAETQVATQTTEVLITIEEADVDADSAAFYEENAKEGQAVNIGIKEKVSGILEDITITPSTMTHDDPATGARVLVEEIGKFDVTFTVRAKITETDRDFLIGTGKVKVGEKQSLAGKGYSGYGTVVVIEKVGGDK